MGSIRWFCSYLFKVKGMILLSLFLVIVETTTLTFLTWVQKDFIDDVLIESDYRQFDARLNSGHRESRMRQ